MRQIPGEDGKTEKNNKGYEGYHAIVAPDDSAGPTWCRHATRRLCDLGLLYEVSIHKAQTSC